MHSTTAPAAEQPGTLLQQVCAILLFLSDVAHERDPGTAWEQARARAMPHAVEAERGEAAA